MATIIHQATHLLDPPAEVFFNYEAFRSNTETTPHHHKWGQLQMIRGGLLELCTPKRHFLTPSHLAIWTPANVTHFSFNREPVEYSSVNIVAELCGELPDHTCQIPVSPIMAAIVDNLRARQIKVAQTEQDQRLVAVLIDQLRQAKPESPFLPTSQHKLLAPILAKLERMPDHPRPFSEWAARCHTTERTLARLFQRELGISFTEWRARMRFLSAVKRLNEGHSVKDVALGLGYHQTSPFITMFKKYAGMTPERYKNRLTL
uniref:AraC family transcriptional regulator n=1 Tax=Thaumasiovibrio occultus TaxID=1891184 RepID=UPI000B3501AF|nr:helix-turn-helix transcriptional regulator [Thaumasiovibrio occultus]